MTDNEFRESWNFSKMVAINIGSVTLSKKDVLAIDDFINRQKAEIEEYQKHIDNDIIYVKAVKAEAVKEFAERVKEKIRTMSRIVVYDEDIDNLVKEFTEEQK